MTAFFTIIYIKTNRLSDEKIAIGLLVNQNGLPEFHYSDQKLSFALKSVNTKLVRPIKRSLQLLQTDVNKYVNGETSIPMFDEPYAKKILSKLTFKKRGLLYFGDLLSLEKEIPYAVLYQKYIGQDFKQLKRKNATQGFKKNFNQYVSHKRFDSFTRKKWLNTNDFPLLSVPIQVDLFRKTNGFTVFKVIDFKHTERTIQQNIALFRMLVESLSTYSAENGLSKGRYYLVYDSPKIEAKLALVNKIKGTYKSFELIRMSEMMDKI